MCVSSPPNHPAAPWFVSAPITSVSPLLSRSKISHESQSTHTFSWFWQVASCRSSVHLTLSTLLKYYFPWIFTTVPPILPALPVSLLSPAVSPSSSWFPWDLVLSHLLSLFTVSLSNVLSSLGVDKDPEGHHFKTLYSELTPVL